MKNNINTNDNAAKKVLLKRRLKYGGLSIALSAVVIAIVIIANVIFTSVMNGYNIFSDLTQSQIYTISDEAKAYLKQLKAPITIKFAVPLDTIYSNSELFMVYVTATQYASLSKNEDINDEIPDIKVEYFDSYKYPAQFEKYKTLTSSAWESTNVIIECTTAEGEDEEESGVYPLVYQLSSFFTTSEGEKVGYNGERRFLLAFLTLASVEQPVVCFTTGHGEPIGKSLGDENNEYKDFFRMFEEFGFRIQWADLTKDEIDKDCRLVVILDPKRDFIAKDLNTLDKNSEIDKISNFVNNHGSLMVFLGPTGSDYPVLDDYLAEWGVEIHTTRTIEDPTNTLSSDDRSFSVNYTTTGLGASVQTQYRNLRTRFQYASPVEILFTEKETASVSITSSFITSADARAYASDTDVAEPKDLGNDKGFDLFVVSSRLEYQDNEDYYSYVLSCGSPEMLKYCASQAYANRGILNVLLTRIPLLKVPVDLDYKVFENYGVASVTSTATRTWTIVLAVAMPLITLVAGTVVVVRRKRK